ncbi:MAG TPA: hypothetical protein OIM34_03945 [Ruminococcus bromii]|nr:hypothetical protein [Ruminococcus bromii]
MGDEKRSVIAGKTLDESPVLSCVVPSDFYPFEVEDQNKKPDYIDGEGLIGETITVKAYNDDLMQDYNMVGDFVSTSTLNLPAIEYKLKVVGTYYLSPTETGYYDSIYISEETATKILDDALTKGGYSKDNETTIGKWWSDLSQRTHYVVVDDFENIESVYNALTDMNVCCADDSETRNTGQHSKRFKYIQLCKRISYYFNSVAFCDYDYTINSKRTFTS